MTLLLLATWLRCRSPLTVPPGLEMDELIAIQISEQVLDGNIQPFYEAGQGREPLFNDWLAGWLATVGHQVFTLRIASGMLSLLGLAAVFAFVRRLFGSAVAFVSLALGATSFWTLFAARAGARSVAMVPWAALSGYWFWRGLDRQHKKTGRASTLAFAAAGFSLGMSAYGFTSARVLPAVFVFFIIYLGVFHRPRLAGRWLGLLLSAFIALLVVLPLAHYLYTHPQADQLEFQDWDRPLVALKGGDIQPVLKTSLATLGGLTFRGDPLIFDNVPDRPIFEPLTALLFLAGVGIAVARWRKPAYAFALIWLSVSLIPGMLSQPAPNFYRIVGAQVVAFAFPGLAIVEGGRFVHRRWRQRWMWPALAGGLALILANHLIGTWRAYFVTWPTVEGVSFFWQTGLAETARYLDDTAAHSPIALCTVLTYEHDPWWRPAWQSMPYLLRRTDLDIRYYDCRSTLVFPSDPSQRSEQIPVRYFFPETPDPLTLIPGEFQQEWMTTSETLPSGQSALLQLDDYPQPPPLDSNAIWLAPEAGGEPATLPVRFGDSLVLQGYQFTPAHPRPGEPLRLITSWKVIKTPAPRLVLFTHLLTDPHTLAAQQDSLALTSHSLRPGDRFLVLHDQVIIPADPAVEQYLLSIGLYDSDTLVRLSIYDGDQARGDRLFLEPVEVGTQ